MYVISQNDRHYNNQTRVVVVMLVKYDARDWTAKNANIMYYFSNGSDYYQIY